MLGTVGDGLGRVDQEVQEDLAQLALVAAHHRHVVEPALELRPAADEYITLIDSTFDASEAGDHEAAIAVLIAGAARRRWEKDRKIASLLQEGRDARRDFDRMKAEIAELRSAWKETLAHV